MQSSFMKDKRPALGHPKAGKNKGKALVLRMNEDIRQAGKLKAERLRQRGLRRGKKRKKKTP